MKVPQRRHGSLHGRVPVTLEKFLEEKEITVKTLTGLVSTCRGLFQGLVCVVCVRGVGLRGGLSAVLDQSEFDWLAKGTVDEILGCQRRYGKKQSRCRRYVMSPELRIAAVLNYIKQQPTPDDIALIKFPVHFKTLHQDCDLILPILCAFMVREVGMVIL